MPKAIPVAAANCTPFLIRNFQLARSSLRLRETKTLTESIAAQAKGKYRNDVSFEDNASPALNPRRTVEPVVGLLSHTANAERQANCVHIVGKSV